MTQWAASTQPDFDLDVSKPIKQNRKRRSPRRFKKLRKLLSKINWWLVLLVVLVVVIITALGGMVFVVDATNRVQASWTSVNRILISLDTRPGTEWTFTDFEQLQLSMNGLIQSLEGAKQRTNFSRVFASLNNDLDSNLKSLDAAYDLSCATDRMLAGLKPALFFLTSGEEEIATQISSGKRVVELLELGQGQFLDAQNYLDQAQQHIDSLDLANASPGMLLTAEDLSGYYLQLQQINQILLDAPNLLTLALGLTDTQNYLILSQNSDEIRPSGGYISTYGWINVRNARVIDYNYHATTATSPNPPPDTLVDQVEIPDWWLHFQKPIYAAWDGSWYADFPSTATMAAWFYDEGNNPQSPVDGVLAIDIVAFEYLLEALGSVTVPGYQGLEVTPENFRQEVYRIRAEGEGDRPHKEFITALYQQIFEDWKQVDQEHGTQLLGAVLRALQEKHIMLYFADDKLNEAIQLLGWAGIQAPATEYDYLMVADANLSGKSSRSIIRQLTYDVEIQDDGKLESRLSIAYDYSEAIASQDPAVSPEHYVDINYQNLMQIFVPTYSILVDTENFRFEPEVVATDTHTIFIASTEVEYNSSELFQIVYTTPPLVEQFGSYQRYRLLLQKQPGMLSEVANIQVALPAGTTLISASPEPVASYSLDQLILEFRVVLTVDQWIELTFTTAN